jgi:hypothetical protein
LLRIRDTVVIDTPELLATSRRVTDRSFGPRLGRFRAHRLS